MSPDCGWPGQVEMEKITMTAEDNRSSLSTGRNARFWTSGRFLRFVFALVVGFILVIAFFATNALSR